VQQPEELDRAITGRLLYFYVLGDVLGSGIYALIGVVALEVGGAIWAAFAVGVGAAMLTGLAYAELITKYPRAGGASSFTHRAFDKPFVTFLVTFAMVSASMASAGALALAFGGYFLELVDPVVGLPLLATGVVFVVVLAYVNFRGISESVKANVAMTLTEVTGLVIVLVVGLLVIFKGDGDFGRPFELNDGNPAALVLTGSFLAFFAMSVVYLIISFLASVVTETEVLAKSEVALLDVVRTGVPEFPSWLFAAIACIAITNTCLVQLITMSRIMYGMGREEVVPRVFSRTHHSRRTPWVAIIATTAVVLGLLVTVGETGVNTLANATVIFLLAVFAVVCVCGLMLRRDTVEHEHYTAPSVVLGIGIVVNLGLLGYAVYTDLRDLADGTVSWDGSSVVVTLILLGVGLVLFLVNAATSSGRRIDADNLSGS
jgi:basic amino acid/polyamine antiporter, APA family